MIEFTFNIFSWEIWLHGFLMILGWETGRNRWRFWSKCSECGKRNFWYNEYLLQNGTPSHIKCWRKKK